MDQQTDCARTTPRPCFTHCYHVRYLFISLFPFPFSLFPFLFSLFPLSPHHIISCVYLHPSLPDIIHLSAISVGPVSQRTDDPPLRDSRSSGQSSSRRILPTGLRRVTFSLFICGKIEYGIPTPAFQNDGSTIIPLQLSPLYYSSQTQPERANARLGGRACLKKRQGYEIRPATKHAHTPVNHQTSGNPHQDEK